MSVWSTVFFGLDAACCAVNVVFFVQTRNPGSLGGAVFCGFCALFMAATAVKP